ncbi:MAG: hypothetical protein BMS9Abin13_241 [Patescibacteria group bacterium]|nr:MAG: hypothetical protein BMS9Abin13_241 [Patescibacteria group bacterium]
MKNKKGKKEASYEKEVLLNFLKSGLTTRQLDEALGYNSKKSNGWESWAILKRYKIDKKYKGHLFCFRKHECLQIIREIMVADNKGAVEKILDEARPQFLECYSDTYLIADSDEKVKGVLGGEVRNITQSFFSPLKKIVGVCQYPRCKKTNLDTVHLKKSRPEIFLEACALGRIPNSKKYNVYKIMKQYVQLHDRKKSICFLCKKHHQDLFKYEDKGGKELRDFRNKIVSDI